MESWFIAVIILAAAISSGIMIYALRLAAKSTAALQALAQGNGWQFDRSGSAGTTRTVISSAAEGWSVTLMSYTSGSASGGGSSARRHTTFEAPDLAADGLAVLGPNMPEKTKAMADILMAKMGAHDIGVWLLNKVTGGLGEEAKDLRSVDGPGPGTLMATPNAETALDALRFAPELNTARAGKNEAQQPIVMRGPKGLQIRVMKLLRKPDDLAAFIVLGRALADNLRSQ